MAMEMLFRSVQHAFQIIVGSFLRGKKLSFLFIVQNRTYDDHLMMMIVFDSRGSLVACLSSCISCGKSYERSEGVRLMAAVYHTSTGSLFNKCELLS